MLGHVGSCCSHEIFRAFKPKVCAHIETDSNTSCTYKSITFWGFIHKTWQKMFGNLDIKKAEEEKLTINLVLRILVNIWLLLNIFLKKNITCNIKLWFKYVTFQICCYIQYAGVEGVSFLHSRHASPQSPAYNSWRAETSTTFKHICLREKRQDESTSGYLFVVYWSCKWLWVHFNTCLDLFTPNKGTQLSQKSSPEEAGRALIS